MTPQEMTDHVESLCKAFDVLFKWHHKAPDHARAGLLQRRVGTKKVVILPRIIDESGYAVALHEVGHCLAPNGMMWEQKSKAGRMGGDYRIFWTDSDWRLVLEEERAAWVWAAHYALMWTPLMSTVRKMAFATYRNNARRAGVI